MPNPIIIESSSSSSAMISSSWGNDAFSMIKLWYLTTFNGLSIFKNKLSELCLIKEVLP